MPSANDKEAIVVWAVVPLVLGLILGLLSGALVGGGIGVPFGAAFGGFGGLLLAPITVLSLRRKPLARSMPVVIIAAVAVWVITLPLEMPLFSMMAVWTTIAVLSILGYMSLENRPPCLDDNHCTKCGYNLTGNESGICPECGTVISKS